MKAKVSKLSLFGFRGATQPVEINFDTTKPVTLVFGENGTGKSTIADALDFVCNRHFGSLEDRSMSAQPKSHVTSLGQDPKKLKVLLASSVGNFTGTLSKDGPVIAPATGCPDARILRRSNILQLLDAQAGLCLARGFTTPTASRTTSLTRPATTRAVAMPSNSNTGSTSTCSRPGRATMAESGFMKCICRSRPLTA